MKDTIGVKESFNEKMASETKTAKDSNLILSYWLRGRHRRENKGRIETGRTWDVRETPRHRWTKTIELFYRLENTWSELNQVSFFNLLPLLKIVKRYFPVMCFEPPYMV